jgi:hypothetical protein
MQTVVSPVCGPSRELQSRLGRSSLPVVFCHPMIPALWRSGVEPLVFLELSWKNGTWTRG